MLGSLGNVLKTKDQKVQEIDLFEKCEFRDHFKQFLPAQCKKSKMSYSRYPIENNDIFEDKGCEPQSNETRLT